MAEGLDLDHQAEAGRIDVAQQLEGERHVLLENRLDVADLAVVADQVEQTHDLRVPRRKALRRRVAVQEEPSRGAVVSGPHRLAEGADVREAPRQAEAGRAGGGGMAARIDEHEAPVVARGEGCLGLVPGQAHAGTGVAQARHQRLGVRMGERLHRDLDRDVRGDRPVHQLGRGHEAAQADEYRMMGRPHLGLRRERLDHRGDVWAVGDEAVGGDRAVLVDDRLAGQQGGLAHRAFRVSGWRAGRR